MVAEHTGWWNSFWIMEQWNAVAGGVQPYVSVCLLCLAGDSWSDCSCSTELETNQSKWGSLLSCLSRGKSKAQEFTVLWFYHFGAIRDLSRTVSWYEIALQWNQLYHPIDRKMNTFVSAAFKFILKKWDDPNSYFYSSHFVGLVYAVKLCCHFDQHFTEK